MKAAHTANPSDVLFQKLGTTWYVFTEINNELVYSALPTGVDPHSTKMELFEVIEEHMKKVARYHTKRKAEVQI